LKKVEQKFASPVWLIHVGDLPFGASWLTSIIHQPTTGAYIQAPEPRQAMVLKFLSNLDLTNREGSLRSAQIQVESLKSRIDGFKKDLDRAKEEKKRYKESEARRYSLYSRPDQKRSHRERVKKKVEDYDRRIASIKSQLQNHKDWLGRVRQQIADLKKQLKG